MNLPSILLFCLVTPFIMAYRLSPGETPYWFFGLIFVLMLGYLVIKKEGVKSLLIWLVIILVIGSAYYSAIIVRHQTAPVYGVHDIILQSESAVQFLLAGKNPYSTTYFGTPLEQWHYSATEINPALFHFVMMPAYLIFSLPFYFLSISLFNFFDGRLPLLFLFLVLLILVWKSVVGNPEKRRLFLTILAFNPATLGYFLEGRSDIFVFTFLFWSWYLLKKRKYSLAGIPLALALATKQSTWPIIPFYLVFLWLVKKRDFIETLKNLLPLVFVFALLVLPFLVWDWPAFLRSTIFYLSGSIPHSYPIAGYGWGMVLNQLGVIGDVHGYYPFWLWQLIIGLPLLLILIRWLVKSPQVNRLIFIYGIFTLVFWYFSRYFNNSHLGYLSLVFLTAYFYS